MTRSSGLAHLRADATPQRADVLAARCKIMVPLTTKSDQEESMETGRLLAQWATWMRAQNCAETTIQARTARIRILEEFAGAPAAELTIDEIYAYTATIAHPSTKATYYAHLRAWYRWLVQAGHRDDDPTQRVKAPRSPRRLPHPVADAHMRVLLAGGHYSRTHVMILLAALAGLRVHEIAKVRGEDVDLVANTIRVTGKGHVTTVLPLHPMLATAALRMPRRGWWFPARGSRTGHVLPRSVTDVVRLAMRRAGVPGSAHSLRHWYGTTLVQSGTDLRTAQTLLRHANLNTTEIYTQVDDRMRRAAVHRLDPGAAA
ncbi:tyrosine-type recombinase/integrase [Nakamurella flava]|nr:tyrosine-type recombinase/integrase [Nakamurella flava]